MIRLRTRPTSSLDSPGKIGLLLLPVLAFALAGCPAVVGNGDLGSESRTVATFTTVQSFNGLDLSLTLDSTQAGDVELELTAESNLLARIRTDVVGATLTVDTIGSITPHLPMQVEATVASVTNARADDGAAIQLDGIDESGLTLQADDGGRIGVRGQVDELVARGVDAGNIEAEDLTAGSAAVTLDNGARATLCVTGGVTGTVHNGARLTVLCGGDASSVATLNGGSVD